MSWVWDGDRFISLNYLCVARMRSRAGPNNYNCIPSIPIDRCDSFDVVFGVFLVQDLALFCSLFAGRFFLIVFRFFVGSNRAAKGTGDTL